MDPTPAGNAQPLKDTRSPSPLPPPAATAMTSQSRGSPANQESSPRSAPANQESSPGSAPANHESSPRRASALSLDPLSGTGLGVSVPAGQPRGRSRRCSARRPQILHGPGHGVRRSAANRHHGDIKEISSRKHSRGRRKETPLAWRARCSRGTAT